jgi:hypothetical protein
MSTIQAVVADPHIPERLTLRRAMRWLLSLSPLALPKQPRFRWRD